MYTKGEWKADKNWHGTYTIYTDDAHIADVDRHFNAQLIAAAPLLYEALKELEPYMVWLEKNNLLRITSLIEKALAKVEGK